MTKMYPQFQSLRAKPLCADYRNYLVAQNASDCGDATDSLSRQRRNRSLSAWLARHPAQTSSG